MGYKARHKRKDQPHSSVWLLRVVAALTCLTLITTYLLAGAYSKFYTGASGGDSARVAKFSPDFTSDTRLDVVNATPGYTATMDFYLQNHSEEKVSETAMSCTLVLKTTGNIPLTFTLMDSADNPLQTWKCNGTSGAKSYEYTDGSLIFAAGVKESRAYKLKAEWISGISGNNDARFAGMTDAVYLEAVFEQID